MAATLRATVARSSMGSSSLMSFTVIELSDQAFEFFQVRLAQLAVTAEVRHQRRHAAVEHAVEEALAFAVQPLFARDRRRVEIAPSILQHLDRVLAQQPVEQSLDGGFLPGALVADGGGHLVRAARAMRPQGLHDDRFGFADLWNGF